MQLLHFIVGLTIFLSICLTVASEDRVMGWNKAHGLWGKRSAGGSASQSNIKRAPQNWNKLNSLWGKRSAAADNEFDIDNEEASVDDNDDVAMLFVKRAQWQRANGLWGR